MLVTSSIGCFAAGNPITLPQTELKVLPSTLQKPAVKKLVVCFFEDSKKYTVNDVEKQMDVKSLNINGKMIIPVRYAAESLGANLDWDASTNKLTFTLGANVVEMWMGNNTAKVNGVSAPIEPYSPAVTPVTIDGVRFIPIRFLAASLGCSLYWDETAKKIMIEYTPSATIILTPPKAPTNLNVDFIENGKIKLVWTDNSDNETGFKIELQIDGGEYAVLDTLKPNTTEYATIRPESAKKSYSFRIRAYNMAGNSAYSNEEHFIIPQTNPGFEKP